MTGVTTVAASYDRTKEYRVGSWNAANWIRLQSMLAHVLIEPSPDAQSIELYGYGDPESMRLLTADVDDDVLLVTGLPPFANDSKTQVNHFGGGVSISASGTRSVAAMNIGYVNTGGSNSTIDGIPIDEYNKAQQGESTRYIMAEGRLIDLTRMIYLRLVVPGNTRRLSASKLYGEIAITGDFTGQLRVLAEYGFLKLDAQTIGELSLIMDGKSASATVERVIGNQRVMMDEGATAIVGGARHS